MKYQFTSSSSRENTNAEKYILKEEKFGTDEVIPAWIADMDLDSPIFVQEALKKRLEHPIFGYEEFPKDALLAQLKWLELNHNISFNLEDGCILHSVTSAINIAIEAFSEVGDNIIVQTPVYGPFFTSVEKQNRVVLNNELIKDENLIYKMDLESLKKQINKKTKLLILCNPHNPVGRVWEKTELEELVKICIENNIIIFSDEVHCDLVYKPYKHIPVASIKGAKEITLSAYGIGKSFNLSGLATSTIYISNEDLKQKFKSICDRYHFSRGNILSHVAAYEDGYEWIDDLKEHLISNYIMLEKLCNKYSSLIKLTPIQATYLAWLDCSGMNIDDNKLEEFFIKEAKLGLNKGSTFGRNGEKHFRLNFAVTTKKMQNIVNQLEKALSIY